MRFPEFSGEWSECQIKEYGVIVTGNTPPTNIKEYYEDGSYLWAAPGDLGNNKDITITEKKLSDMGFKKARVIPKGSILVTCIGSTIGKMGIASTEMATNQQINSVIVQNNLFDINFVYYSIMRDFPRYLKVVSKQAVPILSKSTFEKLKNHKTSINEQRKIGKFLSLIDGRIATQNRIIEELQSLIKGIYQHVFRNENYKSVPLETIAKIKKGEQINGEYLLETGDYYVMNGGAEPSGYYDLWNTEAGTISISEGGNSCGYVQYNEKRFWSGGHCYTLGLNDHGPIDKMFLYHYLKYSEPNIMALRIGSGLPNIQKKDLSKFCILLPPIHEQKFIANGLEQLRTRVNIESKILNSLREEKFFLLRAMFI